MSIKFANLMPKDLSPSAIPIQYRYGRLVHRGQKIASAPF